MSDTTDHQSIWTRAADELRYSWMNGLLGIAVPVLAIAVVVIAAIVMLANWGAQVSCEAMGARMEHAVSYRFFTGCMVRTTSGWVPMDNYRVIERKP